MSASKSGNAPLVIGLVVLGLIFAGFAVFYAVANTDFLASPLGHHYKHAVAAGVAAVVCFIGANFARRGGPA